MRTLTMSLGEYEFDETNETFNNNTISKFFVMSLLTFLIIFGSLTIYNLFVAVVITDVSELQASVFLQVRTRPNAKLDEVEKPLSLLHCIVLVKLSRIFKKVLLQKELC